ncbi:RecX family transcriptional regulator [Candidatus Saccharibacteria bacterium]|nr:RecX family transcriptional regulator [Candidatus Saccharibacteria bacterium]
MEIYKLKDEVPEKRRNSDAVVKKVGSYGDGLRITEMRQGVKNPERVNVYINGTYELSLDVAQVVDYKLKVGAELSEERLAELKKASEFGKLYQRTLEWALMRPRSVREIRDYLRGKKAECADEIVSRLVSRGYLDDRKFAEWWVENRFVKKGVSRKRLAMELMKKGVTRDIVDEVLAGRDETQEIRKMIAKKRSKYDDEKLMAYLCRQGFPYDLVQRLVKED